MRRFLVSLFVLAAFLAPAAHAEDLGCVSTTFRMLGLANDKICIASFADPKVPGVVCYISRAQTGGVKGTVGLAEDPSEAAISCRQVGPITIDKNLKDRQEVFEESRSFWFKKLQVVRFYDKANNTLVYLTYSDKIIEGSPKNSLSAVPIMPWRTE
ncbi:MAG: CreA family protein [Bdellovibrionales bacterium]